MMNKNKKTIKNIFSSKRIILITLLITLFIGVGTVYAYSSISSSDQSELVVKQTDDPTEEQLPQPQPPTETELSDGDMKKEELEKTSAIDEQASNKVITPEVISWGQSELNKGVEVSVLIRGIYEDGGNCTLTLTNISNNSSVTTTTEGFKDAKATYCKPLNIPRTKLIPGKWSIKVDYSSSSGSGVSSQNINIEIQ